MYVYFITSRFTDYLIGKAEPWGRKAITLVIHSKAEPNRPQNVITLIISSFLDLLIS